MSHDMGSPQVSSRCASLIRSRRREWLLARLMPCTVAALLAACGGDNTRPTAPQATTVRASGAPTTPCLQLDDGQCYDPNVPDTSASGGTPDDGSGSGGVSTPPDTIYTDTIFTDTVIVHSTEASAFTAPPSDEAMYQCAPRLTTLAQPVLIAYWDPPEGRLSVRFVVPVATALNVASLGERVVMNGTSYPVGEYVAAPHVATTSTNGQWRLLGNFRVKAICMFQRHTTIFFNPVTRRMQVLEEWTGSYVVRQTYGTIVPVTPDGSGDGGTGGTGDGGSYGGGGSGGGIGSCFPYSYPCGNTGIPGYPGGGTCWDDPFCGGGPWPGGGTGGEGGTTTGPNPPPPPPPTTMPGVDDPCVTSPDTPGCPGSGQEFALYDPHERGSPARLASWPLADHGRAATPFRRANRNLNAMSDGSSVLGVHVVLAETWADPSVLAVVARFPHAGRTVDVVYLPRARVSTAAWLLALQTLRRDQLTTGRLSAEQRVIAIRRDGRRALYRTAQAPQWLTAWTTDPDLQRWRSAAVRRSLIASVLPRARAARAVTGPRMGLVRIVPWRLGSVIPASHMREASPLKSAIYHLACREASQPELRSDFALHPTVPV